jgi:hypothetical protein
MRPYRKHSQRDFLPIRFTAQQRLTKLRRLPSHILCITGSLTQGAEPRDTARWWKARVRWPAVSSRDRSSESTTRSTVTAQSSVRAEADAGAPDGLHPPAICRGGTYRVTAAICWSGPSTGGAMAPAGDVTETAAGLACACR